MGLSNAHTPSTWMAILVDCLLSKYKYEQRNNGVGEEGRGIFGDSTGSASLLPLKAMKKSLLCCASLLWLMSILGKQHGSRDKRKYLPLESMYHLLIFALAGRQQRHHPSKRAISHWLQLSGQYYYYSGCICLNKELTAAMAQSHSQSSVSIYRGQINRQISFDSILQWEKQTIIEW